MKKMILKKLSFLAVALFALSSLVLPTAMFAAIPIAPSNLICVPTSGQVAVHWTDNSTDETGFSVERAPDIGGLGPGTYAQIGTAPAITGAPNAAAFTDSSVVSQTAYWYRVAAVNASGSSFYSNEVRVLTLISSPTITPVLPNNGQFMSGTANAISATTSVSGTTVTAAEYQIVANNAAGVFDARDIFSTQMILTVLPARQVPPAPVPTNDPTDFSSLGLPIDAIAEFVINGRVGAVSANGEWQIGSPAIIVYESQTGQAQSTRFVGSRKPVAGDAVKITAYRTIAAGPLIAKEIRYIAPGPQPAAAPSVVKNFLFNGALTTMDPPVIAQGHLLSGEIWTIGGGSFRIDAPYFPAYIDANVGVGMDVTVRFSTMPVESNIARQIFNQVTTSIQTTTNVNPVFDYTSVPLNVPEGTWLYFIVDGVVSAKDLITGSWTIGDEGIMCYESAGILIAPATVGDEVLMYCRRTLTPGPLVIEQVHNILPGPLIQPYKGTAVEVHMMYNGTIQSMGPNTWTIAGPSGTMETFVVDDPEGEARIDPLPLGSFTIGHPVTVEFEHVGEVLPDDANWAPMSGGPTSWSASVTLPAVSSNLSGTLFLRATDGRQHSTTSSIPANIALMPTAVPNAPTLNTVQQTGATQVTVTWTPAATGDAASSFIVERSATGVAGTFSQVGTDTASPYVDSTVAVGNTYWYQVKGVNILGTGAASNSLSVQVLTGPAPPTNLNAALATSTSVQLTWKDNAGNEDNYQVERAPNVTPGNTPGTFAQIGANLPANSTSSTDTITAGTIYHYRVRAVSNTLGPSSYSNVAMLSSTAPAVPGGPTITVNQSAPSVTLTWVDNSSNETGFRVQRAPDNAGAPGTFANLTTTAANALTYTDSTIVIGTTYWYRIIAVGSTGGTPTPDSAPTTPASVNIPIAPANLQFTVVLAPLSVNLTWSDTPGETSYRIERAPDNAGAPGTWASAGTTAQNVVTFNDTAVATSSTYHYRVIAINTWGESAPSNVVKVFTSVPAAPTNLNVALNTATQVILTWNGVTGATGYRVQSDAAVPGTFVQVGADLPATPTTFTGAITNGATHSYRVIAFNASGASAPSAAVAISYTAPPAPGGVIINFGSATVTWVDNSVNETGFEIRRATPDAGNPGQPGPFAIVVGAAEANPTAPNVTSFVDNTVVQGNTYWYQVIALGGAVPSSAPIAATAPLLYDIPADPITLAATAAAYNTVNLTWVDTSSNEAGFKIQRAPDVAGVPGTWAQIGTTTAAGVQNYSDNSASASTKYHYRVFATNVLGDSALPAGPVSVTTPAQIIFGGGGGGGGAILYNSVTLTDLTANPDLKVSSSGNVQSTTVLENALKTCSLGIPSGVRLQTVLGAALMQISHSHISAPGAAPAGKIFIGAIHDFGPNGAVFTPGITLTLKYTTAEVPQGVDKTTMQLAYWDGSSWQGISSQADTAVNEVRATIEHFTPYVILAQAPAQTQTPTPPSTPAAFNLSNLVVTPSEAKPGEPMNVSVKVNNTGGTSGDYQVVLMVNDVRVDSKLITLGGGLSANVSFTFKAGTNAAVYNVDVNGVKQTFTVKATEVVTPPTEPTTPTTPTQPTTPTTPTEPTPGAGPNWVLIGALIGAGILLIVVISILVQRRKKI